MNPFLEEIAKENMVKGIESKFLGKICTILTGPSALPLKDYIQHSQYYTGEVVGVDATGVWIKHPQNATLAFFLFPFQGIVEEQYIPSTDPRHDKIKEELVKKEKVVPKPQGTTQLIDPQELSARIRASKKV